MILTERLPVFVSVWARRLYIQYQVWSWRTGTSMTCPGTSLISSGYLILIPDLSFSSTLNGPMSGLICPGHQFTPSTTSLHGLRMKYLCLRSWRSCGPSDPYAIAIPLPHPWLLGLTLLMASISSSPWPIRDLPGPLDLPTYMQRSWILDMDCLIFLGREIRVLPIPQLSSGALSQIL